MSSRVVEQPYINELPQEVVESIIDLLANERGALKSCALVQRSWLSRARHHLHRELTIDCGNHVLPTPEYYSTGAAEHIRSLKLIAPPQPPVPGATDAKARTVWAIVPRFTALHSLTLIFSNWTAPGKSYEWLRPVTRHITHLNLVFASFVHAVDFFRFLAMFPELESLAMTNVSFGTAALTAIPPPPPHGLRELLVRGHIVPPDVTRAFALWLCQLPRLVVPQFSLKWEVGQPECLVPILDGLGPRLAHLELPLWSAQHVPSEVVKTALHSVTFTSHIPEIGASDVAEILAFLARVATTELRTLTYDVRTTGALDRVDASALGDLDAVLCATPHTRFPNLETVRFRVPADVAEKLAKGLPRASRRRALVVDVVKHT